jgi:hypothetical protein
VLPSASRAQDDDARAHYERGVALFDEGQHAAALAEFEAAYAVSGRRSILFNIGQIHARLGHAVESVEAFEEYLATDGASITAERRAAVDGELAIQRARIGEVEIRCEIAGAIVTIDQRDRGRTPLEGPVALSAGEHDIEVAAAGHTAYRQRFRLAGGETRELDAVLVPTASTPATESSQLPVLTIVGASVLAAGVASWATFGTWTLLEDERLRRECAPICSRDDTSTLAITRIVSDVGVGITAVGAVVLALGLILEIGSPQQPSTEGPQARLLPNGAVLSW